MIDRLLVVRCPELLVDDEGGASTRTFAEVRQAVGQTCPWVTPVDLGICSLPIRGPARYFGGEEAVVHLLHEAATPITPVEIGVADGYFAAQLAGRLAAGGAGNGIVPAGNTPAFLAPLPLEVLERPELTELLQRLGIRTLGAFSALEDAHVFGRFGHDGVRCHQVARGVRGELLSEDERRQSTKSNRRRSTGRRTSTRSRVASDGDPTPASVQQGFWGGVRDNDLRAARALADVQGLLGPESVTVAKLQGGRNPAHRVRFVTWTGDGSPSRPARPPVDAPWPGAVPAPWPALLHPTRPTAELADADHDPVVVTGVGLLSGTPTHLAIGDAPWRPVISWAGPWPCDERWWSDEHRRGVRLQVVTDQAAHLLVTEEDHWWVEATYA